MCDGKNLFKLLPKVKRALSWRDIRFNGGPMTTYWTTQIQQYGEKEDKAGKGKKIRPEGREAFSLPERERERGKASIIIKARPFRTMPAK